MINKPLFSIIIPVYKVEKYIEQCLKSVLQQSFEDFEVIVVDDGSPDHAPEICAEYAQRDQRIKVIHKENGGSSDARNYGIKAATGSYLIFLDSDDYWLDTDYLLVIAELVSARPEVTIVNFGWMKYFSSTQHFIKDGRVFSVPANQDKTLYIQSLLQRDLYVASAWNKCIKRAFVLDNNIFFKKGLRSEDMAWCGDLLYFMPEMDCLDKHSYIYRQERADSITATVDRTHLYDIIEMITVALQKAEHLPSKEKQCYLGFFAVQYLTLLYNLKTSKKKDPILFNDVYLLRTVLNNDLNYKVKIANRCRRFFGFKMMLTALQFYVSYTKR